MRSRLCARNVWFYEEIELECSLYGIMCCDVFVQMSFLIMLDEEMQVIFFSNTKVTFLC